MQQFAIIFTRNNAETIAADLNDYAVEDLLADHSWELNTFSPAVLCKDVLSNGFSSVSYVVSGEMFERNNPGITLNDKTFTLVREF